MKVLYVIWLHSIIGFIVAEDEITHDRRCYVGVGKGLDEQKDIERILQWGSPVPADWFLEIAGYLK